MTTVSDGVPGESDAPEDFNGFIPEDEEPDFEDIRILDRDRQSDEPIRLVAVYNEEGQYWMVRKQVGRDGEYRTSGWGVRLPRNGPNDHPDRRRYLSGRYVDTRATMFTGMSTLQRILSAPIYGLMFAWMCIKGDDVHVETLHEEGWEPE